MKRFAVILLASSLVYNTTTVSTL